MTVSRMGLGLITALLMGGCGGNDACEKPEPYQLSYEGQRISVPEGLDPLSADEELKIPDASPQPAGAQVTPCLELPPSYTSQKK